jgi:3-hydroxyacyl-CoA dehydrogenase/enoyl-CoA hydratase/3-hydroxybutyryl-CoA epimerase
MHSKSAMLGLRPSPPFPKDARMFEGLRFRNWRTDQTPEGFLTLTLDRPGASANALGREVLEELGSIVERIGLDPPKGVIVVSGKPNSFVVGADRKVLEQ